MPSPTLETIVNQYTGNVAHLLSLGRDVIDDESFSYITDAGLGADDTWQLIRLAMDKELYEYDFDEDDEALEFFGVIHAWKALSELKAPEAKELFQELLEEFSAAVDDDWMLTMFSKLIAPYRAGMAAEAMEKALDENRNEWDRVEYVSLLKEMLEHDEITVDEINKFLSGFFAVCEHPIVNAAAINLCMDFQLTEHYDAIARCYANDWVEVDYNGDLEDVEIALGMRTKRETERRMSPFMRALLEKADKPMRQAPSQTIKREPKIGRNDPCPCGSGKKYKKCCWA